MCCQWCGEVGWFEAVEATTTTTTSPLSWRGKKTRIARLGMSQWNLSNFSLSLSPLHLLLCYWRTLNTCPWMTHLDRENFSPLLAKIALSPWRVNLLALRPCVQQQQQQPFGCWKPLSHVYHSLASSILNCSIHTLYTEITISNALSISKISKNITTNYVFANQEVNKVFGGFSNVFQ